MRSLKQIITSSIVKKQVMGVTGLMLCGFLLTHLAGNFLIFVGSDAFNLYAYTLTSNPLIYAAELVLALLFLSHIVLALKLTIENKKARPVEYYVKTPTGRGSTFASSTMPYTGFIVLVFLVVHLLNFKFGPVYNTQVDGIEMRDLYKTVVEYFQSPLNILWYLFAMLALGIHVSHGFWSAFHSIGFNHPKYNCSLKMASKGFALLITVGYSALPIFCYFQGAK
jgi:succinate dehydrogenase / fumarate reductase cytochrome b subunit